MRKKSQITIYVILALVVVGVIAFFFLLRSSMRQQELSQEGSETQILASTQEEFNQMIDTCLQELTIEAEREYGIDPQLSESLIEDYIEFNLPRCIDFSRYEDQGFTIDREDLHVSVDITSEAIVTEINYPITLERDNSVMEFSEKTYRFPRTVMETLNLNGETKIVSADGSLVMEISPGTKVTKDGQQINRVGIKLLDREFYGMSNSVLAGMLAFAGVPHGARFSQPVKITYYYEEQDIPISIREEDIRFGYYDDDKGVWIGLPTEVDTVENKLTVETTHFSPKAALTNCEGRVTEKIIQLEDEKIEQKCNPCEDWDVKGYDMLVANTEITKGESPEELDDEEEGVVSCRYEKTESNIPDEDSPFANDPRFSCDDGKIETNEQGDKICVKEKWYYDNVYSLVGRKTYTVDFKKGGDTCIATEEDSLDSKDYIGVHGHCGEDTCVVDEGTFVFEDSVLTFRLTATNTYDDELYNTVDACLSAYPEIRYQGYGDLNEKTYSKCSTPGAKWKDYTEDKCLVCECPTDDEKCASPANNVDFRWVETDESCYTDTICPSNLDEVYEWRSDGCYQCVSGEWVEDDSCERICTLQVNRQLGYRCVDKRNVESEDQEDTSCEEECGAGQICQEGECVDETSGDNIPSYGGSNYPPDNDEETDREETREEQRQQICPEGDDSVQDYPQCPDNYAEIDRVTFSVKSSLDTRDLRFCDKFGDFPSGFSHLSQSTELLVIDSAQRGSTCWLKVEAQKEVDGVKQDFYVKYDQVINAILEVPTDELKAPENLINKSQNNESIYLRWDKVTGAKHYFVYKDNVHIKNVSENVYNDTGLMNNTEYSYNVTAFNETLGESNFSNTVTTKTYQNKKIFDHIKITSFERGQYDNDSIYLNWSVKGNYSYSEVFMNGTLLLNDTVTEINITELNRNSGYFFEVYTRWNSTLYDYVNRTYFTVDKNKTLLLNFENKSQTNVSIFLDWTVVGYYNRSVLFRDNDLVYNGTKTQLNDTGLQKNKKYLYRLIIFSNDKSYFTSEINVRTKT